MASRQQYTPTHVQLEKRNNVAVCQDTCMVQLVGHNPLSDYEIGRFRKT